MAEVLNVINSQGVMVQLPLANLTQVFGYDGSNNLVTITVEYQNETYVQTLTWTDGNMTNITPFEVQ